MVAPAEAAGNPLEVWSLFDFAHVRWELVPSALPTWLGMYVVVAFSSSLDVAAIQMDMGRQLDFNHELVTVGLSNLLSGLSGGFTGSYIFSQTLFTFRTGNRSRVCGSFVLTAEILLFLAPFSMVSYVPKLFFGSVLTFIAADLMLDWLWLSRHKVHPIEYLVILTTFLGINLLGLELGMCLGLLVAMVSFIYDYARVPVVQRVKLRSSVIRSLPLSALLADQQEQIITLRCRGYIFFGSTIQIMDSVMRSVVLPPSEPPLRGGSGSASVGVWRTDSGGAGGRRTNSGSDGGWSDDGEAALFGEGSGHCGSGYQPPTLPTDFCGGEVGGPAVDGASSASSFALVGSGGSSGGSDTGTDASSQPTTRFVLFDFSAVSGLDATAARSCFLNLTRTLAPLGITVAFGGVREGSHTERLLIGHEILNVRPPNPSAMRFDTIDEALEHCEEELLKASSPQGVATPGLGLSTSSQRRSQSSGNLTGGGGGEAGGLAAGGAAPMCASPSGGRFAVGGRERSQRAAAMPGWQPSDMGGAMGRIGGVGVPGGGLPGAIPGHTVAQNISSAGGQVARSLFVGGRGGGGGGGGRKLRGPSLSSRPHSSQLSLSAMLHPLVEGMAGYLGASRPALKSGATRRVGSSSGRLPLHSRSTLSRRGKFALGAQRRRGGSRRRRRRGRGGGVGGGGGIAGSGSEAAAQLGRRLVRYVDGGIFGELDFFLKRPRSFTAVASSTSDTILQVLTRDALLSMQSQSPQLCAALEHALLKYLSFQVNAKLGLSDGVRDAFV